MEYQKNYREKNIEKRKDYLKKRRKRIKKYLADYKKDKCCAFCGWKKHPEILVFHHTREKIADMNRIKHYSIKKINEEIPKCIILCPNCHSWYHYDPYTHSP